MINVEEVKLDFEEEVKAHKKAKSELVFKKRIVPIESVSKIEELKKKVKIYFKFVPNKMMLSYKGLVYIFDDSPWPETYMKFPKKKLEKLNEERESNNEVFFKCYLDAISEERTKPLKVKIFECEGKALLIRWLKFKYIINFEGSFSHIYKLRTLFVRTHKILFYLRNNTILMVLKKKKMKMSYQERIPMIAQSSIESLFLRNKLSKIRFTYLDKEIDDYNINFEEVTELSYLMKSLKAHIENKFKKDSSIVEKKKLIYDPVSLFVLSNFGKITKVKSLTHMFELVRSFPGRKHIYFNIMPFFQIEGKVKDVKKCEVVEPELIVKERNSNVLVKSEDFSQEYLGNNFIETLDDINRDRVNLVLEMFPGNDPKKIFDLINTYDGDVDKVMEELLGS